jgi:hypothetical protein
MHATAALIGKFLSIIYMLSSCDCTYIGVQVQEVGVRGLTVL